MKGEAKKQLEEQRMAVAEAERLVAFDEVELPPDTYEKVTGWSREVTLTQCRSTGCSERTENVLCDKHFYRLVRKFRPRLVDVLSTEFPRLLDRIATLRTNGVVANGR